MSANEMTIEDALDDMKAIVHGKDAAFLSIIDLGDGEPMFTYLGRDLTGGEIETLLQKLWMVVLEAQMEGDKSNVTH